MARRNLAAENFHAILAMVGGGLSIAKACEQTPCSRSAFMQYLRRNPDRAEQIRAAQCKPPAGADLARQRADDIVAAIASGKSAAEACKAIGVNVRKFQQLCQQDAGIRKRYADAQRQRGGKAVSAKPRRQWTAADFERALELIASFAGADIDDALGDDLPSRASLERSEVFRARFYEIMGKRAQKREAVRPPKSPTAPWGLLLKALLRNPVYAAAWRYAKRTDLQDRDDIASEIALRILEGEITVDDIRRRSVQRSVVTSVIGYRRESVSLDAPRFDDEGQRETRADAIANDDGILFY